MSASLQVSLDVRLDVEPQLARATNRPGSTGHAREWISRSRADRDVSEDAPCSETGAVHFFDGAPPAAGPA
jgi:hypothetical protein